MDDTAWKGNATADLYIQGSRDRAPDTHVSLRGSEDGRKRVNTGIKAAQKMPVADVQIRQHALAKSKLLKVLPPASSHPRHRRGELSNTNPLEAYIRSKSA